MPYLSPRSSTRRRQIALRWSDCANESLDFGAITSLRIDFFTAKSLQNLWDRQPKDDRKQHREIVEGLRVRILIKEGNGQSPPRHSFLPRAFLGKIELDDCSRQRSIVERRTIAILPLARGFDLDDDFPHGCSSSKRSSRKCGSRTPGSSTNSDALGDALLRSDSWRIGSPCEIRK